MRKKSPSASKKAKVSTKLDVRKAQARRASKTQEISEEEESDEEDGANGNAAAEESAEEESSDGGNDGGSEEEEEEQEESEDESDDEAEEASDESEDESSEESEDGDAEQVATSKPSWPGGVFGRGVSGSLVQVISSQCSASACSLLCGALPWPLVFSVRSATTWRSAALCGALMGLLVHSSR